MYKYIALAALVLGSAALGFSMNRADENPYTVGLIELVEGPIQAPYFTEPVGVVDFNGDGFDDYLRYSTEGGVLSFWVRANANTNVFGEWEQLGGEIVIDLPGYLSFSHVMNVNGDALPDLVFRNRHTYGDIDDEQTVLHDVYLINNGSAGFACTGDLTGDGTTDIQDLLGVIADWDCVGEGLPD